MPVITVKDEGGQEITLFQHGECIYPNVGIESITSVRTLSIRDDDVFICSYPKSGTHWLWDTVRMLVTGRLLQDTTETGNCRLEFAPHDHINALPSPRVLSTHFELRSLPQDIVRKGCKIIYIIRNPKDVAVSYYNYTINQPFYNYHGKWEDYMEPLILGKFAYGSWYDHVKSWEEEKKKLPTMTTVYFEDLKEDPFREIRRLDNFLGTKRSEEFLSQLSDFTTFSKMSQRKKASSAEDGAFFNVYRKGEVGDWKNWFTVAQNEWFDKLYNERMKGTGVNIRFTNK